MWLMMKRVFIGLGLIAGLAVASWFIFGSGRQAESVTTARIERSDLEIAAAASGVIEADVQVEVKSRASGTVIEIVAIPGQIVAAGDSLVILDPADEVRNVRDAEASLSSARARLDQSRFALAAARTQAAEANGRAERRRQALAYGLISGEEHLAAASEADVAGQSISQRAAEIRSAAADVERAELSISETRRRLEETLIRAPISGTVLKVYVENGSLVSSGFTNVSGGTTVLVLADMKKLFVNVKLDEAEVGTVRAGQEARIRVDAFPERVFRGRVERIEPLGVTEANVVTFDVRVLIEDDSATLLLPGMSTDVEIVTALEKDAVLVPVAALRSEHGGRYVILASGERRAIKTGRTDGTVFTVIEGLAGGEVVVIPEATAKDHDNSGGPPPPM
jgi:HlyD family secretion protein